MLPTRPANHSKMNTSETLSHLLILNTGLSFQFNLRKSIAVDAMGQITGAVTPVLYLKAITPSDADAFIDDFVAGVVSVNASGNSFVIQGPHGHQFTVNVNGQTE